MSRRRLLRIGGSVATAFALAAGLPAAGAAPADAADYKGALSYETELTLSVNAGQVTAFRSAAALVPCPGTSPANVHQEYKLAPGTSVPVFGGSFHIEGENPSLGNPNFHWALDATVSLDGRTVTGKLSVQGTDDGYACSATYDVVALLAPRDVELPAFRTFEPDGRYRPDSTTVHFDYKRGVIRRLSAMAGTRCPDGTLTGGHVDTPAWGLDPIPVSREGRFRLEAVVLDHESPVHFTLRGRIRGRVATGRLDAYRWHDAGRVDGLELERCEGHARWRSIAKGPPPRGRVPGGYLRVTPYRSGAPGSYRYHFGVEPYACFNANRVRVTAGGLSMVMRCRRTRLLGPLAPQRVYRLKAYALRVRAGKVRRSNRIYSRPVYLPGEDGHWEPAG